MGSLYSSQKAASNHRYGTWKEENVTGAIPPPHHSSAATVVGKKIYLYGGFNDEDGYSDRLYILDTETMIWSRPPLVGMHPARSSHTLSRCKNMLYLFGGLFHDDDDTPTISNNLCSFNTETNHWLFLNEAPLERFKHSAVSFDGSIFIFGGCSFSEPLNSLSIFNSDKSSWISTSVGGAVPSRRMAQTSTLVANFASDGEKEHRMFVFGGCDSQQRVLSDIHVFTFELYAWSRIVVDESEFPVPGRSDHAAAAIGQSIVFFGGVDAQHQKCNNTFLLDTKTLQFFPLLVEGAKPPPRTSHTLVAVGRKIFLIGGSSHSLLNDCWSLTLDFTLGPPPPLRSEQDGNHSDEEKDEYKQENQQKMALTGQMAHLVNNPLFADVQFALDDGNLLYGHRAILAVRSPIFMALFSYSPMPAQSGIVCDPESSSSSSSGSSSEKGQERGWQERQVTEIRIKEVDLLSFWSLLYFLYTDELNFSVESLLRSHPVPLPPWPGRLQSVNFGSRLELDEETLQIIGDVEPSEVLILADRFCLDELKVRCEEYLSEHLEKSNVVRYLALTERLKARFLRHHCLNFVVQFFEELRDEIALFEISEETVQQLRDLARFTRSLSEAEVDGLSTEIE